MSARLNGEQRLSAAWAVVKAHAEERLRDLRARLEGELCEKDTIATRAQIRELKKLLDLETPNETGAMY